MTESIKHFHLFCGSGSGAAGFNDARPEIPGLAGRMVCLGGMDNDPVPVILFENVPRIATRGRHLLDQITGMMRHYGYVVRETYQNPNPQE